MTEKEKVIKRIKEGKFDYKYIHEYVLPHYTSEEDLDVLLEIYRNNKYEHYFGDITLLSHLNLSAKKFISFEAIKKIVGESEDLYITFVKYNLRNIILKKISTDVSIIEIYTFLIDNINTKDQLKAISGELRLEIPSSVYEDIEKKLYLKASTLNLSNSSLAVIRDLNPHGYHQTIDDFKLFLGFYNKINGIVSVNTAYEFYKEYNIIAKIIIGEPVKANRDMIINASIACFPIMISSFPRELLAKNMQHIYANTDKLVGSSSKINTLSKNPNVTYEFMKYVYPVLGHDLSLKFIRYHSEASSNLIDYCSWNKPLVHYWLKIIKAYNLFKLDENGLHEAFANFEYISDLLMNLMENNISINNEQAVNVKRILVGKNRFNIKTYDELINFDKITINNLFEKLDGYEFDSGIGDIFGLSTLYELKNIYHKYNFANFAFLKELYLTIRNYYGEEKFNEIKFTYYETAVIKLIKSISDTLVDSQYKSIFEEFFEKEKTLDFAIELKKIIRKMQQAYALYLNAKLTSLDCLKYDKKEEIEIYHLKDEPFNFLVHTFEGFDSSLTFYASLLEKEPSLWDKLEGASTISYSSISNTSFNMVGANNPNKIKLLFNKIPEDSFLYMYYQDLMVYHGSHNYNPPCDNCSYTTLEIHNRNGSDGLTHHNEITTYREGVYPCAVLSFEDEPSMNIINYAKKMNLPIVCIDKDSYLERIPSGKTLFKRLEKKFDIENFRELINSKHFFYDRQKVIENLINWFNVGNIDYKTFHKTFLEIEHVMKINKCESFTQEEIKSYRVILDRLHKMYPDKKIKINQNKKPIKKISWDGIFVSVDEQEFLITKQPIETIKFGQIAVNLRKHFNCFNSIESTIFSKNFKLIIQTTIDESIYREVSEDDMSIIPGDKFLCDLLSEFIFDFWLGVSRFRDLPFIVDNDNNLKRFFGGWNLTTLKRYEVNNDLYDYINKPLYRKLFNQEYLNDSIYKEIIKWENALKNIENSELKDFVSSLNHILDINEQRNLLEILLIRKNYILDFLQTIIYNQKNNNSRILNNKND